MLIFDQLRTKDWSLRVLASAVLLGLVALLLGLFQVQVVSARRFKASQVSQSFRTVRVPAIRGEIVDRRGVALADNRPAYQVHLYLEELRPHFQSTYARATAGRRLVRAERAQLSRQVRYRVVSNMVATVGARLQQPLVLPEARFHEHYEQRLALPLPLVTGLQPDQVSRFVEQGADLPGCDLEVQPQRFYPHGSAAAHILGYLRRDDRQQEQTAVFHYRLPDFSGMVGIEGTFDAQLRGQPGMKSVLVNNLGYRQSESVWSPTEPGQNVRLTIDIRLQSAAERALRAAGAETRGAAVVMDVRNGDLLAIVSHPAFDPNLFVPRITDAEWQRLNDPVLLPLINRATYGAYAPGSIFKIVVGLAGLEAGVIHPEEIYSSPGYYQLGRAGHGRRIRDLALGGQPAEFDFKKALKLSSNAYFIHYGLIVGSEKILALGQRLHLGEKTGLPTGQEVAGVFPTAEWQVANVGGWYDGDTANLCIGQGYLTVTPLQMAVMASAVANGGTVYWPRLVARLEPPASLPSAAPRTFPPGRVRDHLGVAARHLDTVRRAMLADVEERDGTGRQAFVPGLRICGKTGTAQVTRGRQVIDHITWFVSFAPFESPRYAVVVMIESGVAGGETCAPVARQIYERLRELDLASPERALDLANR